MDRRPKDPSRREFLRTGAAACGALALPGLPEGVLARRKPTATGVIHIFLQGGLSHIDSFDPKPMAPVEVRGEFRPVDTKIDDVQFSQHLPRLASLANHLTVIRSMTHGEAAHERGTHNMLTGYRPSPAITYPSMGSVVAHELESRNNLPQYVCVPNANEIYLGTGYLSSAYAPFSLGGDPRNSRFRVRDLASPRGVDEERRNRRRRLVGELDQAFASRASDDALDAMDAFYKQAYALIDSPSARKAFDINAEKKAVRERYGMTGIGQRLLMARRLIAGGARYVTVMDGGYDNHENIFRNLPRRLREIDRGLGSLIADMASSGLLDETVVVLTSEFGRTPRVNANAGRDHWPRVFSVLVAGGGIKKGVAWGRSNAEGAEPEEKPVTPPDLAATVFSRLGIDPEHKLMSPGDRPIDIVRDGRIIREIVA